MIERGERQSRKIVCMGIPWTSQHTRECALSNTIYIYIFNAGVAFDRPNIALKKKEKRKKRKKKM